MLRGLRAVAAVAAAFAGARGARGDSSWLRVAPLNEPWHGPRTEKDPPSLYSLVMQNRPNVRGSAKTALTQVEESERRSLGHGADKLMLAITPDPSFWMWKTTPAPPAGPPGPNPQLLWVAHDVLPPVTPAPTTPPAYENCYGCDCLMVYDLDIVQGGTIPNKYTCFGGAPTVHVPKFKWAGVPENSGLGHGVRAPDGTECTKSLSFALTMQDMDFPYGTGQSKNSVKNMFWMANIPGDWTEIDDETAHATYRDKPVVVIGRNSQGELGMEVPCPKWGTHRYVFTFWALKDYLGTETSPLSPDTPFAAVEALLQEKELARANWYGTVHAEGYKPKSFLQMVKDSMAR